MWLTAKLSLPPADGLSREEDEATPARLLMTVDSEQGRFMTWDHGVNLALSSFAEAVLMTGMGACAAAEVSALACWPRQKTRAVLWLATAAWNSL